MKKRLFAMDDLKPCPFCSSEKIKFVRESGNGDYPNYAGYVLCNSCHARTASRTKIDKAKKAWQERKIDNDTMEQMLFQRAVLTALVVNYFGEHGKGWKSRKHNDGRMYDNHFCVGIELPKGTIVYHFHENCWDWFTAPEIPNAPEYNQMDEIQSIKMLTEYLKKRGDKN